MNTESTKALWYTAVLLGGVCWAVLLLQILGILNIIGSAALVDRSWVSQAILFVFGVCLAVNVRSFKRLVQQGQDVQLGFKPDPSRAELKLCATGILGMHADRLQHIYSNSKGDDVSQEVLLNNLRSRLYGEQWVVRSSAQLLLTLGLIGTVIGLAQSLDGLGETVMASMSAQANTPDAGNNDQADGLYMAIGGMGTAFATTLYGAILGGVFLKILVNCTQHLADELVNEIELVTEMELVPLLRCNASSTGRPMDGRSKRPISDLHG